MNKKNKIIIILGSILFCIALYFGYLHLKIREHSALKSNVNVDFMIILGARVRGSVPSLALQYRIDTAAEYLKNNPNTIAIASGGQGTGENITEAEAIKLGLIKQGIDSSRIILENKSTDTVENISFSNKLIPKYFKNGIIVTNDFHIFRAKMIARDNGLFLDGLSAPTPSVVLIKSYFREYLALTKYFLVKYIF